MRRRISSVLALLLLAATSHAGIAFLSDAQVALSASNCGDSSCRTDTLQTIQWTENVAESIGHFWATGDIIHVFDAGDVAEACCPSHWQPGFPLPTVAREYEKYLSNMNDLIHTSLVGNNVANDDKLTTSGGNHDWESQAVNWFYQYFPDNDGRKLSSHVRDDIHVVGINLDLFNIASQSDKDALTNLLNDDDTAFGRRRTIAYLHVPILSSRKAVQNPAPWKAIFEATETDLVMAGHHHTYEHHYLNRVRYLVIGGGGVVQTAADTPVQISTTVNMAPQYTFRHWAQVNLTERNTLEVIIREVDEDSGGNTIESVFERFEVWSDTVSVDSTLTIESDVAVYVYPGTVVHVASGASIEIEGRLLIDGDASSRVIFEVAGGSGSWGPLSMPSAGGSLEAEYTDFLDMSDGIHALNLGSGDALSLANCTLTGPGTSGSSVGIAVESSTGAFDATVTGSTISNFYLGCELESGDALGFSTTTIEDCAIGIELTAGAGNGSGVQLGPDLIVDNTTGTGIHISGTSAGPVISDITVQNCGGSGLIAESGAKPIFGAPVSLFDTNSRGIKLDGVSAATVLRDVTLVDNVVSGVEIVSCSPDVGPNVSVSGTPSAVLLYACESEIQGLSVDDGSLGILAGSVGTTGSKPKVRGSSFSNLAYGFVADAYSGSNFGKGSDVGGNSFDSISTYYALDMDTTLYTWFQGNCYDGSPNPSSSMFLGSGIAAYSPGLCISE